MSTLTVNNGGTLYFRVLPSTSDEIGAYLLHITVSASTKIDEHEETLVQLYPNPTSDNLYVTAPETVIIDFVEFFNEEGQRVKTINGNVSSINVSELSKGMYFIRIHTEGEVVVRKFVKVGRGCRCSHAKNEC